MRLRQECINSSFSYTFDEVKRDVKMFFLYNYEVGHRTFRVKKRRKKGEERRRRKKEMKKEKKKTRRQKGE